jgi:hypothetical protein
MMVDDPMMRLRVGLAGYPSGTEEIDAKADSAPQVK